MMQKTRNLVGILAGVAALAVLLPSLVAAKGPANVSATVHNLSKTGTYFDGSQSSYRARDNEDVCVYCHTPHGGSLTGPLWNRNNPSGPWTHYSSTTLSAFMRGLTNDRAVNDESLMCMSCHDGSIGVNHVINIPNVLGVPIVTYNGDPDTPIIGLFGTAGARIGGTNAAPFDIGDLSDDHPISFSYQDVWLSTDYQTGAKAGQLREPGVAGGPESPPFSPAEGVRFERRAVAGMGDYRVECTTCHDPHVEYGDYNGLTMDYAPFLIMPNAGSNLCLACHIK